MHPTEQASPNRQRLATIRRWVRRGFIVWAIVVMAWLADSYRTRGVAPELLRSSEAVTVRSEADRLVFRPTANERKTALVFFCGSGVAAEAYAPLLRPIAEQGYPVFVIRLPWRFAPLKAHKYAAYSDALDCIHDGASEIEHWVIAGHSLGGRLACMVLESHGDELDGAVLLGTTHPKEKDLSSVTTPVVKVYATNDGVAPPETVEANQRLLPATTTWVKIDGGNHSQFGHYGHQLLDGAATISRDRQQRIARDAIVDALRNAEENIAQPPSTP